MSLLPADDGDLSEDIVPAPGIGVLTRLLSRAESKLRMRLRSAPRCTVQGCYLAGAHYTLTVRAFGGLAITKEMAVLCPAHAAEVAQRVKDNLDA